MGEGGPFILNLFSDDPADRFFFLSACLAVVISIVLHELAHGWAAMRLGDPTPRAEGRMTGNPLVHMGPISLVALALVGFAWGQMPIDRSRLRGKHSGAIVAAAGPAMNVLIAVVCVAAAGVMVAQGFNASTAANWQQNLLDFVATAARFNVLLAMFNLLPAPPLDGSHILASFHEGYARYFGDPMNRGPALLLFFGAFIVTGQLLAPWAFQATGWGIVEIAVLLT